MISAGIVEAQKAPIPSRKSILTPQVFAPGVISTGDYEASGEFSPDGKSFYFVKTTPDVSFWTIAVSRFENNKWTQPEIAPFSGNYSDADTFFSPDGQKMFFVSRRPVDAKVSPNKAGNLDIWTINKTASGWNGEPVNIGAPVNSDASDYYPTVSRNGTLYFGSRRAGARGVDLYRSHFVDGKYTEPENLGDAVNTEFDEYEPLIAPDESFLIFAAQNRADGLGGFDLFISYNRDGKWTKAQNLGAPFNTPADDFAPHFSPDGKYFFWSSTRSAIDQPRAQKLSFQELTRQIHSPQNGLGDIYYIGVEALKIAR